MKLRQVTATASSQNASGSCMLLLRVQRDTKSIWVIFGVCLGCFRMFPLYRHLWLLLLLLLLLLLPPPSFFFFFLFLRSVLMCSCGFCCGGCLWFPCVLEIPYAAWHQARTHTANTRLALFSSEDSVEKMCLMSPPRPAVTSSLCADEIAMVRRLLYDPGEDEGGSVPLRQGRVDGFMTAKFSSMKNRDANFNRDGCIQKIVCGRPFNEFSHGLL